MAQEGPCTAPYTSGISRPHAFSPSAPAMAGRCGLPFGPIRSIYLSALPHRKSHRYGRHLRSSGHLLSSLWRYKLIWYATVQRETNSLASERIPGYEKQVEHSWLLWQDDNGTYLSRPISEERPEREYRFDPEGLLRELLDSQNDKQGIEEDFWL